MTWGSSGDNQRSCLKGFGLLFKPLFARPGIHLGVFFIILIYFQICEDPHDVTWEKRMGEGFKSSRRCDVQALLKTVSGLTAHRDTLPRYTPSPEKEFSHKKLRV